MSQQIINTNKGTADSLKTGATKINSNFTELYTILANNPIAIPSVANNSGKYLTTNGVTVSWQPFTTPNLATVATSGSYTDLTNKPTIPAAYSSTSINALSDVNTATNVPTNGQPLVWNSVSSNWIPGSVILDSLSTLSDVTITSPSPGQVLKYNGVAWINDADSTSGGAGVGTVTNVSVISLNGFAGTVATSSSTPAITITTSITGMLKGNGTAISAATSGTDYAPGTGALTTGIIKSTTTTGALTIAVAGTDYQSPIGTITGLVKGNGANALTAAVAGTDYQSAQSVTGIVKSSGTTRSAAVAGTDYQAPVSATGILKSSGVSGNVSAAIAGTDYQSAQSVTGIVKSSGTTRSAAVAGTDYAPGTGALTTGIIKSTTTTGALTIAVAGTDYQSPIGTITGLVKGNGANALTAAVAGTDYQSAQSVTGIVKSSGTTRSAAVAGTDYQAPVSATGILKSSGVSGNVSAAIAGTDYQAPISLTTNGSSGQATFSNNTLNIPQYTALAARNSTNATTASLANNAAGNITITGWKSYMLLSIQTSVAAWVTVYTSSAARTADASRTITTDPTPGSGVIAEVITTSASTQIFSPAVFGFNDEESPSTDIQVKVVNRSGSTAAITITMKLVQLEV